VHLVGFYYKNISRCMVLWMSHWHKAHLCLVYASVISGYRCAYTFDFRVCTNWTPNCKWPVVVCFDSISVFSPQGSTEKRTVPFCQNQLPSRQSRTVLGFQPVKKFPACYETREIITMFTGARRKLPSWDRKNPVFALEYRLLSVIASLLVSGK